jgi:hypothetical protein
MGPWCGRTGLFAESVGTDRLQQLPRLGVGNRLDAQTLKAGLNGLNQICLRGPTQNACALIPCVVHGLPVDECRIDLLDVDQQLCLLLSSGLGNALASSSRNLTHGGRGWRGCSLRLRTPAASGRGQQDRQEDRHSKLLHFFPTFGLYIGCESIREIPGRSAPPQLLENACGGVALRGPGTGPGVVLRPTVWVVSVLAELTRPPPKPPVCGWVLFLLCRTTRKRCKV